MYCAINREGWLIDCRLSEHRDMNATKVFFQEALEIAVESPDRVTTDKESSYPRAIKEGLGDTVLHLTNRYLS